MTMTLTVLVCFELVSMFFHPTETEISKNEKNNDISVIIIKLILVFCFYVLPIVSYVKEWFSVLMLM